MLYIIYLDKVYFRIKSLFLFTATHHIMILVFCSFRDLISSTRLILAYPPATSYAKTNIVYNYLNFSSNFSYFLIRYLLILCFLSFALTRSHVPSILVISSLMIYINIIIMLLISIRF